MSGYPRSKKKLLQYIYIIYNKGFQATVDFIILFCGARSLQPTTHFRCSWVFLQPAEETIIARL